MADTKFDAIVVGSGAGGACIAWQLTKAGMKTLVIEKGPMREVADFYEGGTLGPSFSSRGRGDEFKFIQAEYLMPELRKEVRFLTYSEPGNANPRPQSPRATAGCRKWSEGERSTSAGRRSVLRMSISR